MDSGSLDTEANETKDTVDSFKMNGDVVHIKEEVILEDGVVIKSEPDWGDETITTGTSIKTEDEWIKLEGTEINPADIKDEPLFQELEDNGFTSSELPVMAHFVCSYCSLVADNRTQLKKHIFMHHYTLFDPNKNPLHLLRDRGKNKTKRQKRGNKQTYSCPKCEFTTRHRVSFRYHSMIKHSSEKPLKCSYCNYSTVLSDCLKNHINAKHMDEKPYVCPHCDFRTTYLGNLGTHIEIIHKGKRRFPCPHCEYAATYKSHLTQHIKAKHTGERPLSCPHCDYTSIRMYHLKNHIKAKHSEAQPHKCTHCNYSSVRLYDVKFHFKRVHKMSSKIHKCPCCEYSTAYPFHIKTHALKHTKGNSR